MALSGDTGIGDIRALIEAGLPDPRAAARSSASAGASHSAQPRRRSSIPPKSRA